MNYTTALDQEPVIPEEPAMPKTRHERAAAMFKHGASNPRAIIHELRKTLIELDDEAAETQSQSIGLADTPTVVNDPALRLMIYQLATVFGMEPFDYSDKISTALDECERRIP